MNGDQFRGRSRPSDKGVGGGGGGCGHPDPEIGGRWSQKNFFGPQFGLKLRGGASPGSATSISLEILYVDLQGA